MKNDILEKNRKWANEINRHLRLTSHPIGLKFFKEGECPKEAERLSKPYTLCQYTTILRTAKVNTPPQYITKDECCCGFAWHILGYYDGKDIASGERDVMIHYETYEGFRRAYESLARLDEGEIEGIAGGALEALQFEPDIIFFAVTPGQVNRFVDGYVWSHGGYLDIKFSGMCGICSNTMVKAYKEKDVVLGFPCFGGRRVGMYQDNEIAAAIHVNKLDDWLLSLDKTEVTGHSFPIAFDLNSETEGVPHFRIVEWPHKIEPAPSTEVVED